jgi:hypothetical protein
LRIGPTLSAFAFAFAIAAPVVARADLAALANVCGGLIGYQVGQCQAAAGGRYTDDDAVGVCGQLIGSQVINCVRTIAGKDYVTAEAANCGRLIGYQVIGCLARSGRPHYDLTISDIRAEIAAALESLRSNDPSGADDRLRRLLRGLR